MTAISRAAYGKYVERLGFEPPPMTADFARLLGTHECWVAESERGMDGYVVLLVCPDHILVDNLAVDPDHHGRGLGTAFLDLAERRAREAGVAEVRLYTNVVMTENLSYYPRRGFRETHRATEHGLTRVFFTKTLA